MATRSDESFQPTSILGESLRFKGDLHADEDLLIRGQVEGSITHSKRLILGRDAYVKATVRGHIVTVEGTLDGDLTADTSVAMLPGSTLSGDVCAPSVSIVKGATCTGKVTMNDSNARDKWNWAPHVKAAEPARAQLTR
jgi:cytoskeletal protein CcmA (bactofilin family)